MKKESSKGRPMRLGRENNTNHDTPGRLKRCLNISSRLDEIVNYLSPKRKRVVRNVTYIRFIIYINNRIVNRNTIVVSYLHSCVSCTRT